MGDFMNRIDHARRTAQWTFLLLSVVPACQRTPTPDSAKYNRMGIESPKASRAEVTDEQIVAFCSGCHAMPLPASFPQANWYDEVKRGFGFYHQSKRKDLELPAVQSVVDYFRSRAPVVLEIPNETSVPNSDRVRFHTAEISLPRTGQNANNPAAISFVGHLRTDRSGSGGMEVVFSDMANGGLFLEVFRTTAQSVRRLAELQHPAAACCCDLNGNGLIDLVVADLGSFNPADHDRGRVVWIADMKDTLASRAVVPLCEGIGRVADVQPADFDGDGDVDLVVAEFGWHQTGRIFWLENQGDLVSPKFIPHVVDVRPRNNSCTGHRPQS